jgi:hypothetical protein
MNFKRSKSKYKVDDEGKLPRLTKESSVPVQCGYLSLYLQEKHKRESPTTTLEHSSPKAPPRCHKKTGKHRRHFNQDEVQRIASRLNVKDAKAIQLCFERHQRMCLELENMHAKVASYQESTKNELQRQQQQHAQLRRLQSMLPQYQKQVQYIIPDFETQRYRLYSCM